MAKLIKAEPDSNAAKGGGSDAVDHEGVGMEGFSVMEAEPEFIGHNSEISSGEEPAVAHTEGGSANSYRMQKSEMSAEDGMPMHEGKE